MISGSQIQLTADQLKFYARDTKQLANQLKAYQYFLPESKKTLCSFMSQCFMRKVLAGEAWLPKTKAVIFRNCVKPPNKETLKQELIKSLYNKAQDEEDRKVRIETIKQLNDKDAPINYLLSLLSTVDPEHEYFRPSYQPQKKIQTQQKITMSVPADFLSSLAQNTKGNLNKTLRIIRSKEEKLARQKKQYDHQAQRALERSRLLEAQIAAETARKNEQLLLKQKAHQNMMESLLQKPLQSIFQVQSQPSISQPLQEQPVVVHENAVQNQILPPNLDTNLQPPVQISTSQIQQNPQLTNQNSMRLANQLKQDLTLAVGQRRPQNIQAAQVLSEGDDQSMSGMSQRYLRLRKRQKLRNASERQSFDSRIQDGQLANITEEEEKEQRSSYQTSQLHNQIYTGSQNVDMK